MGACGNTGSYFFSADAKNSASFMEERCLMEVTTMFMNIVEGFKEMMHCVLTAMNESGNDPYAGWDEWRELEMLNEVRLGVR